jgi:hypothetical protein
VRIQVLLESNEINDTLHEDLYAFMTVSRAFLLSMRNDSNKYCRSKQNTHIVFPNFFSGSRAVNYISGRYVVEPDRTQMKI